MRASDLPVTEAESDDPAGSARPGPRQGRTTTVATYVSMGRSNHFRVRDVQPLKELVSGTGIEVEEEADNTVVLLDIEGTDWLICSEDCEDDIYLPDVIAEHLQPGEVAVFQSIGNEKFRVLGGHSVAVNSDGEQVWVYLSDIYKKAAEHFGIAPEAISLAEY